MVGKRQNLCPDLSLREGDQNSHKPSNDGITGTSQRRGPWGKAKIMRKSSQRRGVPAGEWRRVV